MKKTNLFVTIMTAIWMAVVALHETQMLDAIPFVSKEHEGVLKFVAAAIVVIGNKMAFRETKKQDS
ncbi:hypothetical protein MG296_10540 [Flavobacteriaceae bacterium TK19130]|nr:hypothetical protein [Thermobacterium salinum]